MRRRRAGVVIAALVLGCWAARVQAQGELAVGGGIGVPGGLVSVSVSLSGVGAQAVAADVGLQFDPARLQADFSRCRLAARLGSTHGIGGRVIGSTIILSVFARGLPPLPLLGDGELASCELRIAAAASPGQADIRASNVAVANGNGENLQVVSSDGRVLILASLRGDANCDAGIDAADLEALIGSIFAAAPSCPGADVNADGLVSAADVTAQASLLAAAGFDRFARPRAALGVPAAPRLVVGTARLPANGEGNIDVTFDAGGHSVAGVLNDIAIPAGIDIPERTMAMTELAASIGAGDASIEVVDASALPDFGIAVVEDERLGYGAKLGNTLLAAERGRDGTVAAAHATGATLALPVALPDCAGSDELRAAAKSAVFAYLPPGCRPAVDCTAVRAVVLALEDLGEIPDGIALYRCRVAAGSGDGVFPLGCPRVQAASVPGAGGALAASCAGGVVEVGETAIAIGRADAPPGSAVVVPIEVLPGPAVVGALNVDVVFDPERAAVDDVPCTKAPRLNGHRLTESVIDPGRVRLVIFGLDFPVPPITEGPVAQCRFTVAGDLVPGEQIALGGDRVQIAGLEGEVICGIGSSTPCVVRAGGISVVPTPTATPTHTPTFTPRATATRAPCAGDCDRDHAVSISELMLGVSIGHRLRPVSECGSFDVSGEGEVDVAEIVAAVIHAIHGCP